MLLDPPGFNWCFSFAPGLSKLFFAQGSLSSGSLLNLLSPRFLSVGVAIMINSFVLDASLTCQRFTTSTEQLTKCCEPLQKMRMRLGACKTSLIPQYISQRFTR